MASANALYERWIDELWAGKDVAAEIVTEDFVGHWPDRFTARMSCGRSSPRPGPCSPI
jgi:hypothetical protein